MRERFEALVFDMDGVLVDSEPLHLEATRSILGAEGIEISWEVFKEYVGTTVEATWRDMMLRYGLGGSYEDYLQRYEEAILGVLARELTPARGAPELIEAARERGKRLGLASSARGTWIAATLAGLGLTDVFDVIASGDMVTHGKPAPDIYLLAAQRLGIAPKRCIAIEDAPKGVASAKTAGMYTVGVLTDYNDAASMAAADELVNSLEEFNYDLLAAFEGAA
ncbi:MAG TPA: HAD family phosphatase [Dehalococcoidia bacterium]|nr:HAD family phosphatase [Dehalococcoidia bacterium]